MKKLMVAGVIFALLTANALVAQGAAMPNPPLGLSIGGIDPAASGEYYLSPGQAFTLDAFFTDYITDFALLATPCGPGTTMCWEIIALGSAPLPDALYWSGFVPDNMVPCSFMLALAGHDGMGWWYISGPLVVHVGVKIPAQ